MLDLMRWKRVSETSDSIGCKAVGEKVPLFYRDGPWDGKKHFDSAKGFRNRRYRYRGMFCEVKICKD
jgi:hypothetical protein